MNNNTPHFIIKKNLQKSKTTKIYFSDIVTTEILTDICKKITGDTQFTVNFVENDYQDQYLESSYNKGRLAILHHQNTVHYISFSEQVIGGRNSSVQSVPTAFNRFYQNPDPNKKLYYYFLNKEGNVDTEYQRLIYRLMSTVQFQFLNANVTLKDHITPFNSIDDIILNRKVNATKNKSNNSSFVTKNQKGIYEIYGKTYGANKYETSLLCYACSYLCQKNETIHLYEISDNGLSELPKSSLNVIKHMNNIKVTITDKTLEKQNFNQKNKLRSPRYIYNLLQKLGDKQCALCHCQIPELIQGAHIWPVADIKKATLLSQTEKFDHATSGENGLWLCENHHKLFDSSLLFIKQSGKTEFSKTLNQNQIDFLETITPDPQIPNTILTTQFKEYLKLRNDTQ